MEGIDFHQRRDFSQVITANFQFIRKNFKKLFRWLLIITSPIHIISIFSQIIIYYKFYYYIIYPDDSINFHQETLGLTIVLLASSLIGPMLASSVSYAFIKQHYTGETNRWDIKQMFRASLSAFTKIIWFNFLLILILIIPISFVVIIMQRGMDSYLVVGFVLAGLAFLIAIYLMAPISMIYSIGIIEKKSFGYSLSKCYKLAKGKFSFIFGVLFVNAIAAYIIIIYLLMSNQLTNIWVIRGNIDVYSTLSTVIYFIQVIIFMIIRILFVFIASIPTIGSIFLYFSLNEHHNAVGLIKRIESIGEPVKTATGIKD